MSTSNPNPYAPPKAPMQPSPPGDLADGACPRCKSPNIHRPSFTWWGGALGPKLLSHAVCRACGFGFNWKTGKSNATGIAIYTAVGVLLGVAVLVALSQW
jgi:hypothetical protein